MSRRGHGYRVTSVLAITASAAFALVWVLRGTRPSHDLVQPGTSGTFEYGFTLEGSPARIRVWYDAPGATLADAPVLFVMTGRQRNAEEYRDTWRPLARDYGALLIVPELTDALFPGSAYNLGNVAQRSDDEVAPQDRAFAIIESLFDDVVDDAGSRAERYLLYGHSAGAQFVHRFVLFQHPNRLAKAVAANAGWYTVPDDEVEFPYGTDGSPATDRTIKAALQVPLFVLLGEDDDDPHIEGLRTSAGAMEQGPHRLARGRYFLETARDAARRHDVRLRWRALVVPGAGHDNAEMAPVAAAILLG